MFLTKVSGGQTDEHISWLYSYAIIRLYREFESLVLDALVGAINNDTTTVSTTTGVKFPKHLSTEVSCRTGHTIGFLLLFAGISPVEHPGFVLPGNIGK